MSDWSSDVCSSDLVRNLQGAVLYEAGQHVSLPEFVATLCFADMRLPSSHRLSSPFPRLGHDEGRIGFNRWRRQRRRPCLHLLQHTWPISDRSEEHTSELQSLMRISYAVFCLKKKNEYNQKYLEYS